MAGGKNLYDALEGAPVLRKLVLGDDSPLTDLQKALLVLELEKLLGIRKGPDRPADS